MQIYFQHTSVKAVEKTRIIMKSSQKIRPKIQMYQFCHKNFDPIKILLLGMIDSFIDLAAIS